MTSNPSKRPDSSKTGHISSENAPSERKKTQSVAKDGTKSKDYELSEPKKAYQMAKIDHVNSNSKSEANSTVDKPSEVPKKMNPSTKNMAESMPAHQRINDVKSSNSSSSHSNSLEGGNAPLRPHTGGDVRWNAINMISKAGFLNLSHFRLMKRLGYGDIGSVYLVQLRGTDAYFAMKVMDKQSLASRRKIFRAKTEREILGLLDHPFLPTLYSYFETDGFYCLVMEFCSGGNLHSLRQKQPNKHFTEEAARFFATEILLALEYLHMLGIVYRDLKPENVLVRDEGHIKEALQK